MKKIYLSSFLIVALGLVGWQLGHHLLPTAGAAPSPSCTIMITNIDPKQYSPDRVDTILYDSGLITKGAFVVASKNGALPFQTQAAAQTTIDSAISQIIKEVCGGNCNPNALTMDIHCPSSSCPTSVLSFTVFDPKQYNPDTVDTILYDFGLITKGAFVVASKNGALPFQTQAAAQTTIDSAISQIIKEVCGGECNPQALQIVPQCVTESPVNVAKQAHEQRLSNMNDCQKKVFQTMQANNEQYLANVKKNNQQYYSAMAPITAQFRRDYFATNDSKTKGQILQNYIQQNQVKRKELYNSQAKGLSDFLQQSIKLNQEFAACANK